MNAIHIRGIFGFIATIYVAGVMLHFWYILAAIFVLMLLVSIPKRSKPSTVPAATLAEARRIQSYYSNRR